MILGEESTPTLNYMGGMFHKKGIEDILSSQGVSYFSSTFSPDRRLRHRIDILHDLGSHILPMMDSSSERYHRLWIANANAMNASEA